MVDLHTHSTFSDGTDTPEEIIKKASQLGLKYISITDHDNSFGNKGVVELGRKYNINVITGIELSAVPDNPAGELHILGYYIDYKNKALNDLSNELINFRNNRNKLILDKLNSLGMNINIEEVKKEAGSDIIGRPHIARVIIKKGYCTNKQEVFDKYLKKGAPAYVDKKRITAQEAFNMIKNAGGIPILAHPYKLLIDNPKIFKTKIMEYKKMGLQGLEAYYPLHSNEQIDLYIKTAKELGLFISCGSDYHGKNKLEIKLGSGINGNLNPDISLIEPLLKYK